MNEYPNWVIDLVGAVDQYEDEHAKGESCLHEAYQQIPPALIQAARIVRHYRRNQAGEPA